MSARPCSLNRRRLHHSRVHLQEQLRTNRKDGALFVDLNVGLVLRGTDGAHALVEIPRHGGVEFGFEAAAEVGLEDIASANGGDDSLDRCLKRCAVGVAAELRWSSPGSSGRGTPLMVLKGHGGIVEGEIELGKSEVWRRDGAEVFDFSSEVVGEKAGEKSFGRAAPGFEHSF